MFRGRKREILLVFALCLVAVLPPLKMKRRVVFLTRTPIVLPAEEGDVYAQKFYRRYAGLIRKASIRYDVPEPLIAAVIRAESGFNPYAVSTAGALGLMQLMPDTWTGLGGVGSPYNPGLNIDLGTKYLRELLDQFRGNKRLALAAYNAGPGAVMKYRRIPPYKETRRYVPRVLKYYRKFQNMG